MSGSGELSDRVILITGGARGLGREMALAAAAEGARICITGSVASETFDQTADDVCARFLTWRQSSMHLIFFKPDTTVPCK